MRLDLLRPGGERAAVEVEDATPDGKLHVRWPSGEGGLVVCVFQGGELRAKTGRRTLGGWRAADLEAALALWRSMTGRERKREWVRKWNETTRRYTWTEKE